MTKNSQKNKVEPFFEQLIEFFAVFEIFQTLEYLRVPKQQKILIKVYFL